MSAPPHRREWSASSWCANLDCILAYWSLVILNAVMLNSWQTDEIAERQTLASSLVCDFMSVDLDPYQRFHSSPNCRTLPSLSGWISQPSANHPKPKTWFSLGSWLGWKMWHTLYLYIKVFLSVSLRMDGWLKSCCDLINAERLWHNFLIILTPSL